VPPTLREVTTCHRLWAGRGDGLAKRAFVLTAEAAAQASHFELYQNAEDRRTLRRAVPTGRAAVVGNGVDLARFAPAPEAGAALRAEWGVAPDELLVGGATRPTIMSASSSTAVAM
jgi:hypothetical protein